jgi:hypothetical protein
MSTFVCQSCRPNQLRKHWTQRKRTYLLLPYITDPEIPDDDTKPPASQFKPPPVSQQSIALQQSSQHTEKNTDTSNQNESMVLEASTDEIVNGEDKREDDILQDYTTLTIALQQICYDRSWALPIVKYQ